MKGALTKGFYGRNAEGSYSFHSFVTACCNVKNELSGFREGLDTLPPHHSKTF
jgi:hypothetical protein